MGIFNADVIINIPPAFFSLQKSGLVRVYLTSVFLLLSVPRCFGDQKPQFDCMWETVKLKVDRYLAQSLTMCDFALCRNDSALWSVSTLNFVPAKKGSHLFSV